MTIHIGKVSIHYDGTPPWGQQTQQAFGLLHSGVERYRTQRARLSVIALLIGRWLIAPALLGILAGLLLL